MNIENTVFSHFVVYIIVIVIVYKQSLIRGGGQLLGNDDGVKIPLGSALPVGSIYKNVLFMEFLKYLFCIFFF